MTTINACAVTISNTPGTASGFTVSAAVSGPYRAPAAGDNAKAVTLYVYEGSSWEICASVYTHSGTSFSRGALRDSSTGSAIAFTSAAIVHVIAWDAAALADLTARLAADPLVTVASSGTTFTQAVTAPGTIDITLTGNCTIAFTGIPTGAWTVRLILRQDATGSRTVSWPSGITWDYSGAPTLRTAASAVDHIELTTVDQGTNWLGRNLRPTTQAPGGVGSVVHIRNNGSTTQTLTAGVVTKIAAALTTVVADPDGYWDTTNKRFLPLVAGKYLVLAGTQGGNNTAQITGQLFKNTTQTINGAAAAPTTFYSAFVTDIIELNGSTDYVEFKVFLSGTTTSTNPVADNTYFKAIFLGA